MVTAVGAEFFDATSLPVQPQKANVKAKMATVILENLRYITASL
ncbi:hypothetical protein SDC9_147786 [bioreactor metagenome]|uniref:Uncharacterized protein n=1 Tax=bioreactor metagenome TaxID=1076179 RepID=A0A645EGZ0_9ZZZZ